MRYTTGEQVAGTVVSVASGGAGDGPWVASGASLQADLAASDDSRAYSSGLGSGEVTQILRATNFGGSIPARASICGVRVRVERRTNADNAASDASLTLRLPDGSSSADNKAAAGYWPRTDTYAAYGGPTDQWGQALSAADLDDSAAGVELQAQGHSPFGCTAYVDHLTREVWYELPQEVAAVAERHGRLVVLRASIRADGDGAVRHVLRELAPLLPAALDHVIVLADPTDAPAAGWGLRLETPAGADLLTGPDGTSLCASLAADEAAGYWPWGSTGGSADHQPVVVREPPTLVASDMGADGAALLLIHLLPERR